MTADDLTARVIDAIEDYMGCGCCASVASAVNLVGDDVPDDRMIAALVVLVERAAARKALTDAADEYRRLYGNVVVSARGEWHGLQVLPDAHAAPWLRARAEEVGRDE